MLNYNKIESAINSAKLSTRKLGDILGIPEATYRDRIKKKNLSPDDVEKISDYFNKPISYFFDREDQPDIIVEPPAEYHRKCFLCEEKDRKIIELQEKLLSMYEQERSADLNGEVQEAKVS
jgi:transcriptional regulator with XRE-family HTH domain